MSKETKKLCGNIYIVPNTDDISFKMYKLIKPSLNIQSFFKNDSHSTTILKILTIVCKNIEKTKVNNKYLPSLLKKEVAVKTGRLLLNDLYNEDEINLLYNMTSETTIDLIIKFSNDMYQKNKKFFR